MGRIETCKTCVAFFEPEIGPGECRYHPPVVLQMEPHGRWPKVNHHDWCYHYEESRDPKPKAKK